MYSLSGKESLVKQRANALDLSIGVVERGVLMTSKMTQHVDHSQDFIKAHVESWLKIFGYARHCACVGSSRWALLCKCTRLCWATHGWPRNKENVEPCWAKSLTSFKFDSTVSTPLTPLNRVFKCVQVVESLYSGQIHICTLVRWPNTVFKCLCLIHLYFQTIYDLAPVFCKSKG